MPRRGRAADRDGRRSLGSAGGPEQDASGPFRTACDQLPPQFITDRYLRGACPIEEHDHNSSCCSKFLPAVLPDLVNEIERSVTNCPNACADVDRLEARLPSAVGVSARERTTKPISRAPRVPVMSNQSSVRAISK